MYVGWRRRLRIGTRRRQEKSRTLEAETALLRWFESVLVPGLLHTAADAAAVMRRVIDFYDIPDDLEAGLAARMQRQRSSVPPSSDSTSYVRNKHCGRS